MIKKYVYGEPFETEALTENIETAEGKPGYGEICAEDGFSFTYIMDEEDIVYGLGESNRGINKRGFIYTSNCTDDPEHTEDKHSLYGAHNLIIVSGKETFGMFFDYPAAITFDIGYTRMDTMKVTCENADLKLYVIEGESPYDIVKQFRHVIGVRYRLIPYLYSEYMKAALNDDMYFRPLGFVYPEDKIAVHVEDQLLLGNEIMIAPVYEQNARGRYVYLPEEMKFVKFLPDGTIAEEILEKGVHYVEVALNEIPLFIRKGKCIPVAEAAECVAALDTKNMQLLGYEGAEYTLYEDDGVHKDYDREENYRVLKK